jgi:hypothetical protein
MVCGLYRQPVLVVKGTLAICLGQAYLLCFQTCLLCPVEYVKTPILILQERWPVLTDNSMDGDRPLTLMELLRSSRRRCWTVLLMGYYYLARIKVATYASR